MVNKRTSSPRVERKREARKKVILDTAIALVDELGVEGLTIQRLAAALDYTPGALYRYFDSKHALTGALQRHAIDAIHDRLRSDRAKRALTFAEQPAEIVAIAELIGIARGYVGLLATLPNHLQLVGLMLTDPRRLLDDDTAGRNAPAIAGLLADVDNVFANAAACGALRDGSAQRRTVMYWSALQGVVQMEKMARFGHDLFSPDSLGPELACSLLIGWGAAPDKIAAATLLLERTSDVTRTH